jgi:SAM-dependent methyltransferase
MQDDNGLKRIMTVSLIYEQFQNFVGAKTIRKWLAENYWNLRDGEKVVDIGCGPGVILDYLPKNVQYVGFDISQQYIASARKKHGQRGTFLVGTAEDFMRGPEDCLMGADLVLCNGLLHHLEDGEAVRVLELSTAILAPTGKLVCLEPVFLVHQGRISRWIMSRDRGRNIRNEQEWKYLLGQVFDHFSTAVATSLIKVPYVYIVMECYRGPAQAR